MRDPCPPTVMESRKGEWMETFSGIHFFPLDPRPEEIHLIDIANGLAHNSRFAGQFAPHMRYSVAEHCIHMARWARYWHYSDAVAFACLMHDAAEAYTGDLPRAVKRAAGSGFAAVEHGIQRVICEKFKVSSGEFSSFVKTTDRRVLLDEKAALFPNSKLDWGLGGLNPLGVEIKMYDPCTARKLFIDLFEELRP